MTDPFSLTYDHLWSLVEADSELAEFVKPGNRIRLDKHDPLKRAIGAGDVPELVLRPLGGADHPLNVTSNQFELNPRWDWVITSGDYLITKKLFPVQWRLFIVMAKFQKASGALTFNEKPFIKNVTLTSHESGDVRPESNRGLQGYISVLAFELKCRFDKSLLEG